MSFIDDALRYTVRFNGTWEADDSATTHDLLQLEFDGTVAWAIELVELQMLFLAAGSQLPPQFQQDHFLYFQHLFGGTNAWPTGSGNSDGSYQDYVNPILSGIGSPSISYDPNDVFNVNGVCDNDGGTDVVRSAAFTSTGYTDLVRLPHSYRRRWATDERPTFRSYDIVNNEALVLRTLTTPASSVYVQGELQLRFVASDIPTD